ncbi:Predicted Zn-dependent peptidase [Salinimicrobium catena]|uniref:Predicted Zn-dependent peptidase n=1 Tax=Salinimicrobium catena TaxID=390640 RepID=A0A1H5NPU8_9FLAO|nr:pitrilysin family protein [Salinimicrobium catena]SDL55559.1 Predicted Zn-dependent peptidase [Salinimicrobium catena]SEF03510.1 Predicted Zn-dependent peptidase [Salinimicrobium catena]
MKTSIYTFILALFLVLPGKAQDKETPPQGGEPKDFTLPEKEVINYDNGLKLVLVPYGSIPKATISINLKTGNINEAEDEVWLADLLADLMEEGTTADYSVKDKLAGMGGNLNVGVGTHTTSLSTSVLSEFTPEAMRILSDVLVDPKLPQSELERLKKDMNRNLSVALSRPGTQARKEFFAEIYPDHPYGRQYPTAEQVNSYDLEDVKGFYEENFGAQRATVYVVGNFNAEEVKTAVKEKLSSWRKGPAVDYPIAEPETAAAVKIIDRPGAPQSTIYYGLPVVDPSHEDYIALDVMNSLLGGSFGSRITSNIREDKGYTYSPNSALVANYKTGLWFENADVTTEFTGASIEEINKEIRRLQNEAPSKEELQGIQNYESGIYVLQNSSPWGIISQLSFLDVHNLPESFLVDQVKNINAITPQQIQTMAEKYIQPEKMTLIVVGDKEKIKDQVNETMKTPAEIKK